MDALHFVQILFLITVIGHVLGDQGNALTNLLETSGPLNSEEWTATFALHAAKIGDLPANGGSFSMEDDKITSLPGQPDGVDFAQYSGYVTVDQHARKSLFYYMVESSTNASSKPLILWLNGGPGCSSVGNGGLQEIGPFRVKSDGKTLYRNPYAWNNVANVLFLDSPGGVGFSYGIPDPSLLNQTGDISTARDAYVFLVNWFERFPYYKNRDFYISGEGYSGHFAPQLAHLILLKNKSHQINLKGLVIGNAWMEESAVWEGAYEFLWTHRMYSDKTHAEIRNACNFSNVFGSQKCIDARLKAGNEMSNVNKYNIYAPVCSDLGLNHTPVVDSVNVYNPCGFANVVDYLNSKEVQIAFHARPTGYEDCTFFQWQDRPESVVPLIRQLIASNIRILLYNGDMDGRVPVTSTDYTLNSMKLPSEIDWYPWHSNNEVGGYIRTYEGLIFSTIRGAGHEVPTYQPQRVLTLLSSFLQGSLPPSRSP